MSNDTTTNSSAIDPGPGYRLLEVGEIIQKGDDYFARGARWTPMQGTSSIGHPWSEDNFRPFRRKIEAEPAPIDHTPEPEYIKPPLGLCPEYVWASNRAADILAAMTRYVDAGEKMPSEWLIELDNRLHEAKLVELTEDK